MEPAAVADPVMVDPSSIRLGDEILIGGQSYRIVDMTALPRGGRRLTFGTGETFTMGPATVLWATRRRPVGRWGR